MVVIDDVKESKLRNILQELSYTGWYTILYNIKRGCIVLGGYYENFYHVKNENKNLSNADGGFIIFQRDKYGLWTTKIKSNGHPFDPYIMELLGKLVTCLMHLYNKFEIYRYYDAIEEYNKYQEYLKYLKCKHDAKINRKRSKKDRIVVQNTYKLDFKPADYQKDLVKELLMKHAK